MLLQWQAEAVVEPAARPDRFGGLDNPFGRSWRRLGKLGFVNYRFEDLVVNRIGRAHFHRDRVEHGLVMGIGGVSGELNRLGGIGVDRMVFGVGEMVSSIRTRSTTHVGTGPDRDLIDVSALLDATFSNWR